MEERLTEVKRSGHQGFCIGMLIFRFLFDVLAKVTSKQMALIGEVGTGGKHLGSSAGKCYLRHGGR